MINNRVFSQPKQSHYDVVIVGGAKMGSSLAWFLSDNADFDGTVLVVERDTTYEWSSTTSIWPTMNKSLNH